MLKNITAWWEQLNVNIDPLTAAVTAGMAIALVLVAWSQLGAIKRTSRAELLVQLNNMWSLPTMREARQAVQELLQNARAAVVQEPDYAEQSVEEQRRLFLARCNTMIKTKAQMDPENYSKFQEFLSFFEALGYLCQRRYVETRDIIQLYAQPCFITWQAFEDHIRELRQSLQHQPDRGRGLLIHCEWLATRSESFLRALATTGAHND